MTRTVTVDFRDHLDEMEAALDALDALREFVAGDGDVSEPATLREEAGLETEPDEWDDLDEEERDAILTEIDRVRKSYEHTHQTGVNRVKQWSGSEFTIKQLSWGDQAMRNDLARGDMLQNEYSDPRANKDAERLRTVQVATVETPPDAPANPREYPPVVGEWLYERIDNLNSYGEVTLDDFSDSPQSSGGN